MDDLSLCFSALNRKLDFVGTMLKKHFNIIEAKTDNELRAFSKNHHFFALLIANHFYDTGSLLPIRKLCAAASKLPTLLYGRVGSEEIAFQLAKEGADYFIPEGKTDELLATLNELKERITFRIDLRDFGFDLDRTSYWTRKYLDFIVEDNNYLKYSSVGEIAQQLKISISTIEHALKKDGLFSPKLLLLSLKNYHAAYFSQTTEWTTKIIAERCGFANERELYRSFANKTGVTLRRFCESKDWREFPALCVRRHHKS